MDSALIVKKAMDNYPLLREENYCTVECPVCKNDSKFFVICRHDSVGFPAEYVICKKCGNIFFSKRPARDGYDIYYNKVYDSLTQRGFQEYSGKEKEQVKAFLEGQIKRGYKIADYCKKHLFKGIKILDVGCGMGGTLKVFQNEYDAECYGIDPVYGQVKIAREVLEVDNIYCGMAEDIDSIVPSGMKFDLIVIRATLDHLYDPSLVLNLLRNYCHER
ncbi:MAG: class I SAM-dependent methyltransferase [Proteobacteria bacterium]|nr:class I SAM-dependent methyltransferase [Pseudomonadota bacterium]MBU4382009.1 class I SAM-dependent methyltransferase [Pseudomonadota bacterium]MBU4606231.1 class I SAM-dependent methyltransferase [Pseudomonadota bacterium]MCG2762885.1 class I SAM-dependent methyltransferase [Desulfarculaceae bacterium]